MAIEDIRDQRTMLRDPTAQRAARTTIDTGTGEKRLTATSAPHTSRGQFVNYYKDLGFSATAEGAKAVRADEAKFQSDMKSQKAKVASAQTEWDKANAELQMAKGKIPDSVSQALGSAYNKYASGFVNVNVVDPSGTKIEQTYRLPKEVANNLAATKGLATAWVDNGKNFNVSTRVEGGAIRGKEIHEEMANAVVGVKNNFYEANRDSIAKQLGIANKSVSQAESNLAARQAEIGQANTMLQGTQAQRDKMWSDLRGDYQNKLSTMAEVFNNFKVEEGNG